MQSKFQMIRPLLVLCAISTLPADAQQRLKFEVVRATYGAPRAAQADVTERVRSYVTNDSLSIQVNAEVLGVDPVPNTAKTLTVVYRQDGVRRAVRAKDFDTLRIGNAAIESLRITKAQYGDGRRMRDVTSILNGKIAANRLELAINNANLGGDPAPAVKKFVTIEYEYNGRAATARLAEGETLRLPDGDVAGTAAPFATASLRIVKALYTGGRRGTADVTTAVTSLVNGDTLELAVNGSTLGIDPAPGVEKTLSVEYEINGQRQLATARDGETLRINKAAPASALRILGATYSGGRRLSADVTRAVASRVSGDSLELTVNGDTLGVDPAPGAVKTLTVEYEFNGRRQTVTAKDSETLMLPPVTTFVVTRATYGVPGRTIDATNTVNARRTGLRLDMPVNGESLGGDPAPGVVKTLTVEYEVNGSRRTATARDGESLRLPNRGVASTALSNKGPVAMAGDFGGARTACLYRQPNFSGEAVCFSPAQAQTAIANGHSGFRSLRLNGVAAVDVYEQPNYTGRGQSITADVPDLLLLPGAWWRYESAAAIQSARAR